jgi:hypothetical protein
MTNPQRVIFLTSLSQRAARHQNKDVEFDTVDIQLINEIGNS